MIAALETLPTSFLAALIFLLGLLFGSFVTLAAYRLPKNQPITYTRSKCPCCSHALGVKDLFPLLSWCITRAKCRYCGAKIHYRYPLIEITQGLLFLCAYGASGLSLHFMLLAALSVLLLIMIVIDFEYKIIPDSIQVALAVVGVVYHISQHGITSQLVLGPLAGFSFAMALRIFFTWWKKQEALGLGDVKFLAVAGLFLTQSLIIPFLLMAGVIGIATALVWQKISGEKEFPFGPALASSLYLCVLVPKLYSDAYEQLLFWLLG